MIAPWAGRAVFHLGPERDRGIFADLDAPLGPASDAEVVVCTGLFDDDTETPETYRGMLEGLRARKLPMICANPDIVVERGDRLVPCAGGIAQLYEQLGGSVVYAGKPHAPIYARALEVFAAVRGQPVPKARILAIGDGLKTDIAGAREAGLRSLFIASALHVPPGRAFDGSLLAELFADDPHPPIAAQAALAW